MSNTRTFGTPGSTARSPDPAASQASKTDSGGSNLFGASNPNSIDIKQHLEDLEQKLNYVYDNYVGGSSFGGSSVTSIISGKENNFPEGSPTRNITNNPGNYIVYNGLLESGNNSEPSNESYDYPLLAMLNKIDWSRVKFQPLYTDSLYTLTKFERGLVWDESSSSYIWGEARQKVLSLRDAEADARSRYTDPDLWREYIANIEKYFGSIKYTFLHANGFYGAAVAVKLNDYWRARTDWAETNYDWPGNLDMPPSRWGESLDIYDVASYNYVGLLAPSNLAPWPPDELQPHEPYLIPTLQSGQTISHEYYIDGHHPWADMQYAYDSEGNEYCRKVLSLHNGSVRLTANEIDFLDRWPRHSAFYDATKQAFIKLQYDSVTWAEHMEVNGTVTINGGYWREEGTTPGRYPGLHVYGDIVIHDGQIRYESS